MYKVRTIVLGTVLLFFAMVMCSQAAQGVINVNKASKEELMMLPGIGEKTAENVIAYRQANGRFTSIDNLTRVKGFNRKKLDKIRQNLALDGQSTYIPDPKPKSAGKNKKSKA